MMGCLHASLTAKPPQRFVLDLQGVECVVRGRPMARQATPCSRRLMPRQQQRCSQLLTRKKLFTGWFLISPDAIHPILLKTRTNPAPFPNKARGRVKPTALSSHPKHRHEWYKSLAGVFAAPVCLAPAHLAANPADGYLTSEVWRCEFAEGSTQCDSAAEQGRK